MGKIILNSIVASLVFSSVFIFSLYITKAWSPDSSGLTAQNGDVLTAEKWNQLVPNSMVGAFMADSCPVGWKPADGTDGTVDLRGQFLRGINSFDAGVSSRTDGNQDPDGASRTFGSYQGDEFKAHSHKMARASSQGGSTGYIGGNYGGYSAPTNAVGGTETRPKNTGVIYCVKK